MQYLELVSVSLVLLNCVKLCYSGYGDVNKNCSNRLTQLDSYMSSYVGKIQDFEAQHATGESYRYVIGVCVDVGDMEKHRNCGIMQYGKNLSHCLGRITSVQTSQTKDKVWKELTYTKGSSYSSHCNLAPRMSRIVFICDPAVNGQGRIEFLEENNQDELCYYMFSLAAKAVCGYPANLSVGDILLIIAAVFFLVWLLAMAGGLLYNRYVMGAKGWEQVPLVDWYKELGNLEADGCEFVCRTRSSKPIEYKEPSFGADTDEEDDEKDDNLLPM